MPAWQPPWTDVRFDHAKAHAAIDGLRRCADLLDRQTDRRVNLAHTAQREWRGRAREAFDVELARMTREAADLIDRLRRAAAAIETAAEDAVREQRRRIDERDRWWDEKRREDTQRAAQGLPPTPGPVVPRPVRVF